MPTSSTTTVVPRLLTAIAWVAMLLVSELPDVVLHHAGVQAPGWLLGAKIGVLVLFLGLTLSWRTIRALRPYAVVLLVLFATLGATGVVRRSAWYQGRFNYEGVPFFTGYAALFVLDIVVALAVIAALWLLTRSRAAFFLVVGDLNAPIEPVPWLGIRRQDETWTKFAFIFAGVAGLAVLVPTVIGLKLSAETLVRALPLLPAVLLLAAVNAFTEEVYFRASFLATLVEPIGRVHALLITVVFFGLAHYLYGSPPGIVGAAMTGFLAYLLGKAMLETKGLLWPWFIHFVPDVIIFASYAIVYARR
jgi:membrane protease YdiL (CAAX protease family)